MVNKYLGKRVKDKGKKGLSNLSDFLGIITAILYDVRRHSIDKKTARGRLLLLYRLTYKKNNKNLNMSMKSINKVRALIKKEMRNL